MRSPGRRLLSPRRTRLFPDSGTTMPPQLPSTLPAFPGAGSTPADASSEELRRLTTRLTIGLVFGVPLVVAGIADGIIPDKPVTAAIGELSFLIIRAGLCTLLVFACAG